MREMIDQLWATRKKCQKLNEKLASQFAANADSPPIDALNMVFNQTTQAIELSEFYWDIWGKRQDILDAEIETKQQQNAQRLIQLGTSLFLGSMSSIEFCMKTTVVNNKDKFGELEGRLYLRKLISRSGEIMPETKRREETWKYLIELRNCIVHNNAIAEKNLSTKLDGDLILKMEAGEMTRGSISSFPIVVDWLVCAYSDWCKEFLTLKSKK